LAISEDIINQGNTIICYSFQGDGCIETRMRISKSKFSVGQLITHKLFNYRGVIVDVDPVYLGSEDWYQNIALTRPPRDAPWYRVLVHNALHETYVAERNLEPDDSLQPIIHPQINDYFCDFVDGLYIRKQQDN
jgi:heat shock protein HspQ